MQDYPIGAFLFWEISKEKYDDYDFYYFLKDYHEKNNTHNPKANLNGNDNVTAVLDGQQRLTSLYIGLKGSYAYKMPRKKWNSDNAFPKRKLYLNIIEPEKEGTNKYQFAFLVPEEVINDEHSYWFEVGKILNMTELGDVMSFLMENISFSRVYTKDQGMFANKTLSQLYNVIHTQPSISYYKENSVELDKVLNIFIRVNSGGTVLSYSDLLLSIASAQWEQYDAREEITEFVENVNDIGKGFNINKDFVLKTALVLSDFSDIAFKVDNFNKANMMKIESKWSIIKKAIQQAFRLVSSFGYSGETLSSNNAVIPIAYYLMTIGLPDNFEVSTSTINNRAKIKTWLIRSLLKKAFSGSPDNVIRPIRDIIRQNGMKEFPLYKIVEHFKGNSKSIIFTNDDIDEYLLKLKYGKMETLSTLMLLYPSLDFNNNFHVDHMYPKSKFTNRFLKSKGIPEDKIDVYKEKANSICNLQLIAAIPNIEKQNKDFQEWFDEMYSDKDAAYYYRSMNYLPDMEYSYSNFLLFIAERQKLLKETLSRVLLTQLEEDNEELNDDVNKDENTGNDTDEQLIDENGVIIEPVQETEDSILGQIVIHRAFGEGKIISYNDRYITVLFDVGKKNFIFPDAFKTFLKAKNEKFQDMLLKGLALR